MPPQTADARRQRSQFLKDRQARELYFGGFGTNSNQFQGGYGMRDAFAPLILT